MTTRETETARMKEKGFLTIEEVSEELGRPTSAVERFIKQRTLKAVENDARPTYIPEGALKSFERRLEGSCLDYECTTFVSLEEAEKDFSSRTETTPGDWLSSHEKDYDGDSNEFLLYIFAERIVQAAKFVAENKLT